MREFIIPKNPYDSKKNLYTKDAVVIEPGITVLCGCNGSGKTTLLNHIKNELQKDQTIKLLSFDNYYEGGSRFIEKQLFYGNMDIGASAIVASEGERIILSISQFAKELGKTITNDKPNEAWILLDAIGSGLSIDNIDELKDFMDFVRNESPETTFYFVIASNEYEFAEKSDCIDVRTFKHLTFSSYDEYRKFILKSREIKNKRYE